MLFPIPALLAAWPHQGALPRILHRPATGFFATQGETPAPAGAGARHFLRLFAGINQTGLRILIRGFAQSRTRPLGQKMCSFRFFLAIKNRLSGRLGCLRAGQSPALVRAGLCACGRGGSWHCPPDFSSCANDGTACCSAWVRCAALPRPRLKLYALNVRHHFDGVTFR